MSGAPDPRRNGRPALFAGRGAVGTVTWLGTVSFAAMTVLLAFQKGRGWGVAAFAVALALGYTFLPWIRALPFVSAARARAEAAHERRVYGTLTVDDWGVTRVLGEVREAVPWSELAWVRIYTTSDGPWAEDFFFVLGGGADKGCLVPNRLAAQTGLLGVLQQRLPGLDNEAVARASGSVTEAWFTIWTRPPEAPVV